MSIKGTVHTVASKLKGGKKKGQLHSIHIAPADNGGYTMESRYHGGESEYDTHSATTVHESYPKMSKHLKEMCERHESGFVEGKGSKGDKEENETGA